MKLICLLILFAALPSGAAAADQLKTFRSKAYGFELDYPADFRVRESTGAEMSVWSVSFFADPADEEPCFSVEVRPLRSLRIQVKTLGKYLYNSRKKEWRLEPGYEEESASRLSVSYLTPARLAVYPSLHTLANAYRDDTILTNKNYALVLRYSDATKKPGARKFNDTLAGSLRLIGIKAIEASIINPPPPDSE